VDSRLRLGSDALLQPLLEGVPGVLEVAPCFHGAADWAALVRQGVIDGAMVSSLYHSQPLPAGRLPGWEGVRVVPLGALELQLVCHGKWAGEWDETVLLPSAEVMPPAASAAGARRLRPAGALVPCRPVPGRRLPIGWSSCSCDQSHYRSARPWRQGSGGRSSG
jgi:hypothetical protein